MTSHIVSTIRRLITRQKDPRAWSNSELAKFSHLFTGKVVNVSGWRDEDKQGKRYKDYFISADEYNVSNFRGFRGLSGLINEFFLDLEDDLPPELKRKYDIVFSHTTLEHIFNIEKAFDNLCELSNDIVIIVVPFAQIQHHALPEYGDYWRFTTLALQKMFEKTGFDIIYSSQSHPHNRTIYTFSIASRNPTRWENIIGKPIPFGSIPHLHVKPPRENEPNAHV